MFLAGCFAVPTLFRFLASLVELSHGLLMLAWGLGLPLLVWRGMPRLRRAYIWFSLGFVAVSLASRWLLGECVLTTWARWLWEAGGGHGESVPFIVTFTNRVASVRPSTDTAVLIWEVAIVLYCLVGLWGWRASARPPSRATEMSRTGRNAPQPAREC